MSESIRSSLARTASTIASRPARALSELVLIPVSVERIAWACFSVETRLRGGVPDRGRVDLQVARRGPASAAPRPAGRRSRAPSPSGSSRSTATISLLPSYSCSCSRPAGTRSSPATTSTAIARGARRHALVELGPSLVLGELLVLGLEHDPAGRRPLGRAELDQGVALLAPALGLLAAGVGGADRPRDAAIRSIARVDPLLEAEALAGAASSASASAVGSASAARVALSARPTSRGQRLDPLAVRLRASAAGGGARASRDARTIAPLKSRRGLDSVLGREGFVRAPSAGVEWRAETISLICCWTEPSALGVEGVRDPLGELLVARLERTRRARYRARRMPASNSRRT